MKSLIKNTLFVCFTILLASCDANKTKVNEIANKFVEAVTNGDKVTIFEIYPNARNYANLSLPKTITTSNFSIEFNESDSIYIVTLNDKQKIVISPIDPEIFQITDSYNVLNFDSTCYELGVLTGVPLNSISDMTKGNMFSNEGQFMQYLSDLYPSAANGNLYSSSGRYSWGGGGWGAPYHCEIHQPITNDGDKKVEGGDYTVEFVFSNSSTGESLGIATENGPELAPGETYVIEIEKNELYKIANQHDLSWYTRFVFKNATTAAMLQKYGSFTGKEFDEFQKAQADTKESTTEKEDTTAVEATVE